MLFEKGPTLECNYWGHIPLNGLSPQLLSLLITRIGPNLNLLTRWKQFSYCKDFLLLVLQSLHTLIIKHSSLENIVQRFWLFLFILIFTTLKRNLSRSLNCWDDNLLLGYGTTNAASISVHQRTYLTIERRLIYGIARSSDATIVH